MSNFEIPAPKYSEAERAHVAKYFGPHSNSKLAAKLMKENPVLYHNLKKIAQDPEMDLVAPPKDYYAVEGAKRPEGVRRVPDAETVDAIASYDHARCLAIARKKGDGHGESMFSISKNPVEYRKLVLAMKYFDVLPPTTVVPPHAPTPKPVSDDAALWSVPNDVADALNLQRGSKTEPERLLELNELAAKKTAQQNG